MVLNHLNLAFVYQAVYGISAPEFNDHLQKAVALAPKVSAGERLVIEALQASAENNPIQSIQLWEQVVQKYPNDKRAHAFLGYAYYNRDEDDKAIEHLKQADQENPYTLYLSAVAESKAGDKVKAIELFKKVADWNEDSLDYAFVRSKAMMAIKQEVPN